MTAHASLLDPRIVVPVMVGLLTGLTGTGFEDAHGASQLSLENARARVTIPGRPAAGYVTIRNSSDADAVVSASSPMAGRIELHTHLMENGVMKMRRVERVSVPAGGMAEFKPGGYHLMIFGLKPGVKPGDNLPLTLTFDKAGPVDVEFRVEGIGKTSE